MAYEFVKYEKKDKIGYITLNRPELLNALHPPCHVELGEIYDEIAEDPDVWVVIVTGAGERAFSAGNDLKATAAAGRRPRGEQGAPSRPATGGFGGNTTRWNFVKPIVAAVNGWAMGGGFEIVLASDIVIAADHAQFGLPEPRVGLLAGAGGIHRLPRQLGMKRAMGMILTGKPIDAQTALDWGLVNEVVPMSLLMEPPNAGQEKSWSALPSRSGLRKRLRWPACTCRWKRSCRRGSRRRRPWLDRRICWKGHARSPRSARLSGRGVNRPRPQQRAAKSVRRAIDHRVSLICL